MKKTILALAAVLAFGVSARAQTEGYDSSAFVARSSGTVRVVQGSSQTFTAVDTSTNQPVAYSTFTALPGSFLEIIQSTSSDGAFCCSPEVDGSTSVVQGTKGCIQAKKEPGGGFYELVLPRFWTAFRTYCLSLVTTRGVVYRLFQQK